MAVTATAQGPQCHIAVAFAESDVAVVSLSPGMSTHFG